MKNTLPRLSFAVAVFCLQCFIAQAQWTEIPLPYGYHIYNDFDVHHGKVYTSTYDNSQIKCASTADYIHWSLHATLTAGEAVGTSRTIPDGDRLYIFAKGYSSNVANAWFSDDDAQNWTALNLPTQATPNLFLPMGNILLCVSESAVYRSADSGASWDLVLQTVEKVWDIKRIGDQNVLITTASRLFHSDNLGAAWTDTAAPFDASGISNPLLNIYPTGCGLFISFTGSTTSVLFRSPDGGFSWSALGTPNQKHLRTLQFSDGKLWGVVNEGIAVSQDCGATWEFRLTPHGTYNLKALGDTLFSGGDSGFFKSYDNAATWLSGNLGWEDIGPASPFFGFVGLIGFHNDRLFISASGGLFSTVNDGVEWRLHSEKANFNQMFSFGDTLLFFGHGELRSFDGGNSWEYLFSNPVSFNQQIARTSNYLVSGAWFNDFLFRSADWGTTWETQPVNVSFLEDLAGADDKVYLSAYEGIHVSSDNGQNFSLFNNGLGSGPNIAGLWGAGKEIFTVTGGQLYRRVGNQWKPSAAGLFDDFGYIPGIYAIIGENALKILAGNNQTTPAPLIYSSEDGGQTWQGNLEDGLPATYEILVALKGTTLYAAGENTGDSHDGIWKREITVGTSAPSAEIMHCTLQPNPASGEAWLLLDEIPGETWAVEITDLTGRQVWEKMLDNRQQAQLLTVAGFSPGVYFVSLRDSRNVLARKRLVVVR